MLDYNEVVQRKFIVLDGEPYEVLTAHVFRKQMRKPVNATKLRNVISGRIVEHSFQATDRVEEAEIDSRNIKFLYANRGVWMFCEENNPAQRFEISEEILDGLGKYLKPNTIVEAKTYGEKIFGIKIPIKVELKVTDAPPAVRGDTAKGGNKVITLETGATLNAPMFINPGDIVRINTETGEYVERVS